MKMGDSTGGSHFNSYSFLSVMKMFTGNLLKQK